MITDAIKAADALLRAVPLLQGSGSQQDYREALELVEYLLENDEHHPLIDMLAKRSPNMKITAPSLPHSTSVSPNSRRGWPRFAY